MRSKLILATALSLAPFALTAQEDTPQTAPVIPDASPTLTAPELPQPQTAPAPEEPIAPSAEAATEETPVATDEVFGPQLPDTPLAPVETVAQPDDLMSAAQDATTKATEFLRTGGPSIWVIAALSVITVALILWKIWRLALIGAWSRGKAGLAVDLYEAGNPEAALATVRGRRGIRSKVVEKAITALGSLPEDRAREDVARVAKREIGNAGVGLRALELIATIAPLLGLLGTVLGMIAAFQALQQSGNRADPALLAGGIWEALLTTAAGMAVAIPASAALTWFEAVIDRIRRDVEDGATRLFVAADPQDIKLAAE